MYSHSCTKCKSSYEDSDEEAYLCEQCKKSKAQFAAEIDARIAARGPKKVAMSALQQHDASPKIKGFAITRL
ncbi:MAG: hypothetical protein Q6360_13255 [Candidatus Brocadiales bacterium]|nr:hypothetical protein [Candidatus Brocadiales bacterium]